MRATDAVIKTVVVTDLVDSTALLEKLGDKRASLVFARCDRAARSRLADFGGQEIDKTDGFLLLFDRPIDACRYVIAYHSDLAELSVEMELGLFARAGIHLGEVFLRENSPEDVARGAKPIEVEGLAKPTVARLAGLAQGRQTLLTRSAFELARRAAVSEPISDGPLQWMAYGPYLFKGVGEPVDVFEIGVVGLAPLSAPSDSEKARRASKTGHEEDPLADAVTAAPKRVQTHVFANKIVGRDRENEQLMEAFRSTVAGRGMLICVSGEAGLGKTALIEKFLQDLSNDAVPCAIGRGRCSEHGAAGEAYLPLLGALDTLLSSDASGGVARRMRMLAPHWYVRAAGPQEVDAAAQVQKGLGVGSPEGMKRELSALFQALSRESRLVIFLDDLHWADDSTIDEVSYLASQFDQLGLLLVTTYRGSELQAGKNSFLSLKLNLQARSLCKEIELGFLNQAQVERYIALEFPENRFPGGFPAKIHSRTEGHPLFVADLLRYLRDHQAIVQETGVWVLSPAFSETEKELPESVRSMIQRKMDQIDDGDRGLLVSASVQGYEFDSAVMARVLEIDPMAVEERLEKLERVHHFVRLIAEQDMPDGALSCRYQFIHALYQQASYVTLRPTRRSALSGATARALLGFYGTRKSEIAAKVAPMLATARDFSGAAECYMQAAENAASLFAYKEAATASRLGLESLNALPPTNERAKREIPMQLALGRSLALTVGYTHSTTLACFSRASELAQDIRDDAELFPAIFGLWMTSVAAADCGLARGFGQMLMRMAETSGDPILLAAASYCMAFVLEVTGDLEGARKYAAQTADCGIGRNSIFVSRFLLDPVVGNQWVHFRVLWLLGYPDQAKQAMRETLIQMDREEIDPRTVCGSLISACCLHQFLGEAEDARKLAERAVMVCNKYELPLELQWALFVQGWAISAEDIEKGIAQMRRVIEAIHALGALMFVGTYYVCAFAQVLVKAAETGEALRWIEQAIDFAERTGHRYFEPELHRLKGESLFSSGVSQSEAEQSLRLAMAIARGQHARSLELRAAVSLARFLSQRGKGEEARDQLLNSYGWFAEGFDSLDLMEAKALLEELS